MEYPILSSVAFSDGLDPGTHLPQPRTEVGDLSRNVPPVWFTRTEVRFIPSRACLGRFIAAETATSLETSTSFSAHSSEEPWHSFEALVLFSGIAFATPVLRPQPIYQVTWSIRWRYIRPTSATHLFCFQRRVDYDISELRIALDLSIKIFSKLRRACFETRSRATRVYNLRQRKCLFSTRLSPLLGLASLSRTARSVCASSSEEPAADIAIGIGRNRSRNHTALDCQMLPVTDTFRFRSLS